jgi:ATP-dependent helicase/nuclease subunit A
MNDNEIVRAGAGAGKTYSLTHKVMDLADDYLRTHKRLPRLVVTTFTRKATQELRERLILLALEERPHLLDFVNSRSNLVVSTIHGVMDLYLKRYGANTNVDPSYRILSEPDALKIARQVMKRILFSSESESVVLLEDYSFNALVSLVRRLDVILLENPEARPFSKDEFAALFAVRAAAAAKELRETGLGIKEESLKPNWQLMGDTYVKLAEILSQTGDGSWEANRERFANLLAELPIARKSGKGAQPVSIETMERAKLGRKIAKEFLEPYNDPAVWKLFVSKYGDLERLAKKFTLEFYKLKSAQGFLEIKDLELLAMDCIRKFPQTASAFSSDWDHWLIDEFQDTSPFQVQLLKELVADRPCYVVGDPQQSIYLFRGARTEVFFDREKQVTSAGGRSQQLPVNRRSRPELLLFLNDFFSVFEPPFRPMEPFLAADQKTDSNRLVATIFVATAAEKPSDEESLSDETVATSSDDERTDDDGGQSSDALFKSSVEMRAMVCHVQALISQGARYDEICILGRTKKSLIEAADWLSRYQLPCSIHAGAGFYDRREIRDALAYFKFLSNPHDDANTVELLRSPWFRLPDDELARVGLERPARVSSLWSVLSAGPSSLEYETIGRLKSWLGLSSTSGFSEAFRHGLIDSGFIDFSHAHDISGRRESNIWKLLARCQQEECKPGFNPLAFIHAAASDLRLDEGNADGDAVAAIEPERIALMTVHASKGLEFRHVLLPRMEQKPRLTVSEDLTYDEAAGKWAVRVPFGEDRKKIASLPEIAWLENFAKAESEEHARVVYVALTRAIESVYLSWTGDPQAGSWAEMVRLSLESGRHKGRSYTYDVLCTDAEPQQPVENQTTTVQPRAKWQAAKTDQDEQMTKVRRSVSVSELIEGHHQTSESAITSERKSQLQTLLRSAAQGTNVHRLLELLKYPKASEKFTLLIERWFPKQIERVTKAVEFVKSCQKPPLLEILTNGEAEWGFSFISEGLLIEGQIDLFGRTDQGEMWIADYKTGTTELRKKAFTQMAIYATALRKARLVAENETIHLAAVYPFTEEVFVESNS